jgi:RNA polymerase subunit RPABC4/transcription elongation factor Spt4
MEYIIVWILCGIIAAVIGSRKGQSRVGFLVGFLLGPLGIVLAIVLKGDRKECPHCRELIHREARACPRCQRVVSGKLPIACPFCGNRGSVSNFSADDNIECPACRKNFLANEALIDA